MTRELKSNLLAQLPVITEEVDFAYIQHLVQSAGKKLVVLDDDPTGSQTVWGVPIYTKWSIDILIQALKEPASVFYILTNTRSMTPERAADLNKEIALNLKIASAHTSIPFRVISRSDSTLRGHFLTEVDALLDELDEPCDGILVIPFFIEGGRYTIEDIHYVEKGKYFIPMGETEYAQDTAFGYQSSNLKEWVEEKTKGRIKAEQVCSISLDVIRRDGQRGVQTILKSLKNRQICIVNAVSYQDLYVFVAGLLAAEAEGKNFIYRTAASFVRVRAGIEKKHILANGDFPIPMKPGGGLVIAGSYIKKSSVQIEHLKKLSGIENFVVQVEQLLDEKASESEIERVVEGVNVALGEGKDVLVYTSRKLIHEQSSVRFLEMGNRISDALVKIVSGLNIPPCWIIAKGGITSSDIATKSLKIVKAEVLGQAATGVPVWQLGGESRFPGLVYVVFPGNVGDEDTIAEVVLKLRGAIL